MKFFFINKIRLCGSTIPPPFITDELTRKVKLSFYSDNSNYAQGFNLNYNYVRVPECKYNIVTSENISHGQIIINRELTTYYYCDWFIKTDSDKSILLSFKNENLGKSKYSITMFSNDQSYLIFFYI
jgi:hypothetical protein